MKNGKPPITRIGAKFDRERAYAREYERRPYVKERLAAYRNRPDVKKRRKLREKKYQKKWRSDPKVKQRIADYHTRCNVIPERRAQIMLSALKSRLKREGKECAINKQWIQVRLENGVCECSGLRFTLERNTGKSYNPYSPSIDRIDSSKGYTPENCRMILWALNAAFCWYGENVFAPIASAWLVKRGI